MSAIEVPTQSGDIHRVVVFATPDDPHAIRDILVDQLNLHATEAQYHAHAVPGVMPDRLCAAAAAQVAQAIREAGVSAAAMPESAIPNLRHATTLHHVRCLPDVFEVMDAAGDVDLRIPWDHLELISVGYVPLQQAVHYDPDPMVVVHSTPRPGHAAIQVPSKSGPEAWMLWRSPQRCHRIDHNLMNHEYLGPRKTKSATLNFRLLLGDVVRAAPDAYLTPATRAFLEHGLLRHFLFQSTDELREHTTFHAMLLRQMVNDEPTLNSQELD